MQRIDATNGCLCVVPGSHRGQLFKHEYPNDGVVNKAYHGIQGLTEADALKMVNVEMDVGDTIFFHPLLVHGSGRNNSAGYRKAISCHYASCDCHFIEVSGTMQEDIAREVEHMAKSKSGMDISFMDVWKFKSRLVFGKEKDFC
jgi:phytanoyl-CoA hydroxylase